LEGSPGRRLEEAKEQALQTTYILFLCSMIALRDIKGKNWSLSRVRWKGPGNRNPRSCVAFLDSTAA
jgi:hypothetical protein